MHYPVHSSKYKKKRSFFFFFFCLTNWVSLQPALGPDGKKKEPESNVLLASIENMQYAVTVDVLHTVSAYVLSLFYMIILFADFTI